MRATRTGIEPHKVALPTHQPGKVLLGVIAAATLLAVGPTFAQSNHTAAPKQSSPAPAAAPSTTEVPWGSPTTAAIVPSVAGGSFDLLTRLRETNVILDEQLKIAQKKKAIEQLEQQQQQGAQTPETASSQESGSGELAQIAAMGGETRVLLVEGKPTDARAMIALPTGGTILVREGDVIPHVGQVVTINADTVEVRTSSHEISSVPFWNEADKGSASEGSMQAPIPPPLPARVNLPRRGQPERPATGTGPMPTSVLRPVTSR